MSVDRELARFDREVASLEGTLDMAVKMAARLLDALRNEEAQAVADTGVNRRKVDLDFTKRVREAVSALEAATRAKVTLDKTAALRAKQMTQEQRLIAFEAAVSSMTYGDRRRFLLKCVKAHNDRQADAIAQGLAQPAPERIFVDVA